MSEVPSKTDYRCNFCRNSLTTLPIEPSDWPWLVVLLRPCRCPHCFAVYKRPLGLISKLPGVKWFASKFSGTSSSKKRMLSNSDIASPAAKFMSGIGRLFQTIEETFATFFSVVFSVLWSAVTWLPSLLIGKKRRRKRSRRRGKFLKSDRS